MLKEKDSKIIKRYNTTFIAEIKEYFNEHNKMEVKNLLPTY